ncbi:MAG: alpha,alpha-trehalase [Bacteroidales bacterium]|nr:alpha,alpha-trehalase [Bacteroidales bacterium]
MTNSVSRIFYILIIYLAISCQTYTETGEKVSHFIKKHWDSTVEFHPVDTGTLIGLPFPYVIPTVKGENTFREMYYWDTYFTNAGLLLDGRTDLAKNNVENILYLVNRFGKMPNGSRTYYLNRSQPPYLSMMVADIFKETADLEWLKSAITTLENEYRFWMEQRITPCGLNRYSSSADTAYKLKMAEYLKKRFNDSLLIDSLTREEKIITGSHHTAEAESGWDFTPRFQNRCEDFCPVDLNSYLYLYEKNFAWFYQLAGNKPESEKWRDIARKRKALIHQYCINPDDGLFYDYDYVNDALSSVLSSAIFTTLFAGVASEAQAEKIAESLEILETTYGLATCEPGDYKLNYQWSGANGWAPLHFLAVNGLDRYGYYQDASRIARKYVELVERNFVLTGNLWEKYNIEDGSVNTINEYEMPAFLGWTAATYNYTKNYLEKNK